MTVAQFFFRSTPRIHLNIFSTHFGKPIMEGAKHLLQRVTLEGLQKYMTEEERRKQHQQHSKTNNSDMVQLPAHPTSRTSANTTFSTCATTKDKL
jgi:hypothetical protein